MGNVYIEFWDEADVGRCIDGIGERCYSGKKIMAEFGNCHRVEDSVCSDDERGSCTKGEQCSFSCMPSEYQRPW